MGETSGWSLRCVEGPLDPSSYEVSEAGLSMGRGEFNSIVLNSGNVSRKHARVFLFEGIPYVQDMGSRNGVYVNGERIQEQSRLSASDTIAVGEFRFQVLGAGAAASAGGGPPKRMIMIGAGAVGLIAIILIAVVASSGGSDPQPAPPVASVDTGAAQGQTGGQSLFDFKEPVAQPPKQQGGSEPAPGQDRQIDVASTTLAGQGGEGAQITAEQRERLVKDYLERGLRDQEQGRLKEAKTYYERAIQLDTGCVLCRSRLERVDREIQETSQKAYDAALRYYNGMRYEEAVANWELVLNLQDDHSSEMYKKSLDYIAEARSKLEASRQY